MDYTQLINNVYKETVEYARGQGWIDNKWKCSIKVDMSPRRTRSWGGTRGGVPFVSLAIRPHLTGRFEEYASFKHDPEIGSIEGSAEKAIAALTVHELAHAIQYSGNLYMMAGSSVEAARDPTGHGALWRKLYRALRMHLINNRDWTATESTGAVPKINASVSRSHARELAITMFQNGNKARQIINNLILLGMKKTTATTYVYEVKSKYAF